MLGQMYGFIGIIRGVELRLGGEEDIIRDAGWGEKYLLKANSYLGDLYDSRVTFCIIFC